MKHYILILLTYFFTSGFSQKNLFITIEPQFNGVDLQMNTQYTAADGKVLKLDHFDYYISNIIITHDGGQTTSVETPVFLVEPQNHVLYLGYRNWNDIEKINFLVGVPKPMNTQNGAEAADISTYPETNPLSFQSPSMYWGWQAGYMHMIIGGNSDGNNDGNPESYFEIHNLGNNNQQEVEMNIIETNTSSEQIDLNIICNVNRWVESIPLSTVGVLHGENGVNETILQNVLSKTVFTQSATATIQDINPLVFNCFGKKNGLDINWENLENGKSIKLIDQTGKVQKSAEKETASGSLSWDNLSSGFYFVELLNTTNQIVVSKKVMVY